MLSNFGTTALRVPRRANPYLVARKLARLARMEHPDLLLVRDVLSRRRKVEREEPKHKSELPVIDVNTSDPEPEGGAPAPAFADAAPGA